MESYTAVSPLPCTGLLSEGSAAVSPTPGRHQPLLYGSSSPVLPIGNITPVPIVWELPEARTLLGSQQKQRRLLCPRERC